MRRNYLFIIMLFVSTVLLLAACGAGDDQDETGDQAAETNDEETEDQTQLIMGTSADYPPFESYNPEGDIVGFDIDLANYIADELGVELDIRDMGFDGLIGALQSGRVDMVISGMSADEDRRENVDFSIDYHHSGEMFVTQEDSDLTSLDDLDGTTIGVQLGSIQQEGAKALQEEYDFEVKALDEAQGLIQELLTNRIDAAYLDKEVALGFIEAQGLTGFDDPSRLTPGMAVAFPKDSDLVEQVDEIIEQAIETGVLAEWEAEWLSEAE
ncbi:transporter substrate-binding domain-containing protein [Amphibacillus sp. Q70]|uniref:transporter substrate-binding domain-containing protein n=1 Tax=Amphibacillus sp. Q70 TaxID=3453416 RepID=UPI003F85D155